MVTKSEEKRTLYEILKPFENPTAPLGVYSVQKLKKYERMLELAQKEELPQNPIERPENQFESMVKARMSGEALQIYRTKMSEYLEFWLEHKTSLLPYSVQDALANCYERKAKN
jgi:hypothetical protein